MTTMYTQRQYARLVPVGKDLAFESSFDRALVSAFKFAIPAHFRRWDPKTKRWLVATQFGQTCANLAEQYLGVHITVPMQTGISTTETRLLRIEYIGRCKERNDDELSAFAYTDGSWSVVFPERALRDWFSAIPEDPREAPTLFAVLGIAKIATGDEIKAAYRRLAKLTHPDVNKEPDAKEQFMAVQHAWEVLSNEVLRRKYLAGLRFAAQAREEQRKNEARDPHALYEDHMYDYDGNLVGYRCPLRCGWLLLEGQESIGRFIVSKILHWEDIKDSQGRTLVTSWPKDATMFISEWV